MTKINKEMLVGDIVASKQEAADILIEWGMGCLGCPASQAETLEDACDVHGLDVNKVVASLNKEVV